MLRVRVHVVESNKWPAPEKIIWDELAPTKDATKLEGLLRAFATDPMLMGEMLGLRLRDGHGRGCQVEGSLLRCELRLDGKETIADVHFSGDTWRVW